IGSGDGAVYAIQDTGASGGLANSTWPKFRHDVNNTGLLQSFPPSRHKYGNCKWATAPNQCKHLVFDSKNGNSHLVLLNADTTITYGRSTNQGITWRRFWRLILVLIHLFALIILECRELVI
ncbi:MAG: hypothetical protein ABIK94_06660, partial [candidate division WOR-3 bacterium]